MAIGINRIIPQNSRTAIFIGAVIGFVASIALMIPSANDTDSGFVFLLLLPALTVTGAVLWFLLSKLIYGNAKKKWLYIMLLVLLIVSFFLPSPFVLLLGLFRQNG